MNDYNLSKTCCFFVSSTHLTTMMLPNIKRTIDERKSIITFFEYNLKNNMDLLLTKTNLEKDLITKIREIDWRNTNNLKYICVEKKLKEIKNIKDIEIFVCGSEEYVDLTNKMIEKFIGKQDRKKGAQRINIINCFQADEFKENIQKILKEHEYYLNTAGREKIENVFGKHLKKENID